MKFKRKGNVFSYLAFFLVLLTLVGVLGALAPFRRHSSSGSLPSGSVDSPSQDSEVFLEAIGKIEILPGEFITGASYANGDHFLGVFHVDGKSKLLYSKTGLDWSNALDDLSDAGNEPIGKIIDEIVYHRGNIFFGFSQWQLGSYGVINRFTPGPGSGWRASLSGGDFYDYRYLGVIDEILFCATFDGKIFSQNDAYEWVLVGDLKTNFIEAIDFVKCGDLFVALVEYYSGDQYLFTASELSGTWTKHAKLNMKVTSIDASSDAVILACDDGKIAYSTDFSNFEILSVASDDFGFLELFFFNGKHYAIGRNAKNGALYESANGGISWEKVAATKDCLIAASVGVDEVFLYGKGGDIYRLTK